MSYNEIALQKASKHHKSELAAKDAEIAALREALGDGIPIIHGRSELNAVTNRAKIEVLREVLEDFSVEYQPFRGLRDCIRHLEDKLKALEATK